MMIVIQESSFDIDDHIMMLATKSLPKIHLFISKNQPLSPPDWCPRTESRELRDTPGPH